MSRKRCKLEDVLVFGNGKVRPTSVGEIPVFGGNGILDYCGDYNYNNETIIIGRVGAYCGSVFYSNGHVWVSDNALSAKTKPDNDAKYFYYFLRHFDLNQYAGGSSHPLITQTLLNSLDIEVSDNLEEQKAIASVLSSLDDKIDLLHKQNKTLEAMAETLFRQWFIEEAKEEWEEEPLDQIAEYLNGLACQKYLPKNEIDKLPVLKIKELRSGFSENSDWATSKVPSEYIIHNGDIVFSWSGSLLVKIWDGNDCILNQHLFKVTSDKYPKWFYYLWTKKYLQEFISIAQAKSTTMGHIKREDLSNVQVLAPIEQELVAMSSIMEPIIENMINNNKQIQTLSKLRDALLPKLMSGEVKVK